MKDLNKSIRSLLESDEEVNAIIAKVSGLQGLEAAKFAVDIVGRALGHDSEEAIQSLLLLAVEYLGNRDTLSAEGVLRRIVTISSNKVGKHHADYAMHLSNLAGVVGARGQYVEAEALHREVLAIYAVYNEVNPAVMVFQLFHLAEAVQKQDRLQEAKEIYEQALKIEATGGEEIGVNYAALLNNLATIEHKSGQIEGAYTLWSDATRIYRENLGDRHPNTQIAAKNLLALLQTHFPDDPEIPALQALLAPTA